MTKRHHTRNRGMGLALAGVAAGMLVAAYGAVPLYRLICEVTGMNGTTQRAEKAPGLILERTITVRFNAVVASNLAWEFKPVENTRAVAIGSTELAFYEAVNVSDRAVTGTATFNVTPAIAGRYFMKIECFCFKEQALKPGEKADFPVTFFIDPAIVKDPDARDIKEITLSYTFFPLARQADAGARTGN